MPKFRFNKLVRDKIADHIQANGGVVESRILDTDEYVIALKKKLAEELAEYGDATPEEELSEIADVYEILDTLAMVRGFSNADITAKRKKKNEKNGAFEKALFIDHIEIDENDPWLPYYRENADRYPEINE